MLRRLSRFCCGGRPGWFASNRSRRAWRQWARVVARVRQSGGLLVREFLRPTGVPKESARLARRVADHLLAPIRRPDGSLGSILLVGAQHAATLRRKRLTCALHSATLAPRFAR